MKGNLTSSNDAEVLAIANGFYMVCHSNIFETSDPVLIQSDCQHALRCIDGELKSVPERQQEALDLILGLATEYHIRIVTKHIRGHQGGGGRNWVNRRCDHLAGIGMRAARRRGVRMLWKTEKRIRL